MRARCTRRTCEGGRFHSIGMIRLDGGRDSILATAYGGRMDPKGRLMTDGYTSIEHRDPLAESLGDSDLPSEGRLEDRKSTRLNSSHGYISYAVFCLKKKKISAAQQYID